jgi:predicted ABC-type ATPase
MSLIKKRILMIAGPNGAGKTTWARAFFATHTRLDEYLNADEIARGLAPLHPNSVSLAASKLLLLRLKELLDGNKSFAFETTAAGTNYVKHLKRAKSVGYEIHLMYLWIATVEGAIQRVAQRVAQGGHSIPEETIRRRYHTGLQNALSRYLPLADDALIFDNSTEPILIARKPLNCKLEVIDPDRWTRLEELLRE